MKTVGEILKETRLKKGISLEQVEKTTKIRSGFLRSLEENDFTKIGQVTTIRGFLRNYGGFLGLPAESILAVFRRDFLENEKGQIIPRGLTTPLDKTSFTWNPKLTVAAGTLFLVGIFLFYLLKQYLSFISAPAIVLVYPPVGEVVKSQEVELLGKTAQDATLYINGEIVNLKENGEFNKKIVLKNGENEIIFEVTSRKGKTTREIKKIKAEIP